MKFSRYSRAVLYFLGSLLSFPAFAQIIPIYSAVAVNPTNNKVYVGTATQPPNAGALYIVDGNTNTEIASLQLGGYDQIEHIVANSVTNKVYVTSGSHCFVIDGATDSLITTINSCSGGLAVDSTNNYIYAQSPSYSINVISGATDTVVGSLTYTGYFSTATFDPNTNQLFSGDGGSEIFRTNISTNTFTRQVASNNISNVVYSNSSNLVYATEASRYLEIFDPSTLTRSTVLINVDNLPLALASNDSTGYLYVTTSSGTQLSNHVTVLNESTNTVVTSISTPPSSNFTDISQNVAVNAATNTVYVANGDNTSGLTVIDGSTNSITTSITL